MRWRQGTTIEEIPRNPNLRPIQTPALSQLWHSSSQQRCWAPSAGDLTCRRCGRWGDGAGRAWTARTGKGRCWARRRRLRSTAGGAACRRRHLPAAGAVRRGRICPRCAARAGHHLATLLHGQHRILLPSGWRRWPRRAGGCPRNGCRSCWSWGEARRRCKNCCARSSGKRGRVAGGAEPGWSWVAGRDSGASVADRRPDGAGGSAANRCGATTRYAGAGWWPPTGARRAPPTAPAFVRILAMG